MQLESEILSGCRGAYRTKVSTARCTCFGLSWITKGASSSLKTRSKAESGMLQSGRGLRSKNHVGIGHPITILSTLPSIVFGVHLTLPVAGTQLALASRLSGNGVPPVDGFRRAAPARVRSIITTMLVTVSGVIPSAVGVGPGYEIRQPLGIAIVGRLLAAQVFRRCPPNGAILLTGGSAASNRQSRLARSVRSGALEVVEPTECPVPSNR